MLPLRLDSPVWRELRAHFGNAAEDRDLPAVPKLIDRWKSAVGTYEEEYAYDPLRESYLHQRTVSSVAYAVVPHLAERLPALSPDRRLEVLDDIAEVESVRRSPPEELARLVAEIERKHAPGDLRESLIASMIQQRPPLPETLAASWFEGLDRARAAARGLLDELSEEADVRLLLEVLCGLHGQAPLRAVLGRLDQDDVGAAARRMPSFRRPPPRTWRRHVRFLRSLGWGDGDIVFACERLTGESEPGSQPLLVLDADETVDFLRRVPNAPADWAQRTGLAGDQALLVSHALRAIAWAGLAAGAPSLEERLA